jgi:prepilin-type N-terminal cleavage/methylation domain-containing protein/prepilin-type processing-associated H-X9-DG protein
MRTEPIVQQTAGRREPSPRSGFTIVEMMAVIAIILVVVGLLTAALNSTRAKTMRVTCLDNMKQLQFAWGMYADDHNDYVVLNKTAPPTSTALAAYPTSAPGSWVTGNPKLDRTPENLAKGTLFSYVKNVAEVYRCPMDSSVTRYGDLRTRSYSISAYLGGDDDDLDPRVKMRTSELVNPPPERVFVFIEEHERSIWAGGFLVIPRERFGVNGGAWSSTPADRHMVGCNLSFADGHIEYWKWNSAKKPSTGNQLINSPGDLRDLRRLEEAVPKP